MPVVLNTPYVPSVPQYDKVRLDHLTITELVDVLGK